MENQLNQINKMKKFLGILVLGLLWCNVGLAKDPPKKDLDENFVFKPEKTDKWGKPTTHSRISQNSWNLRYDTEVVRNGKYSLRFEWIFKKIY